MDGRERPPTAWRETASLPLDPFESIQTTHYPDKAEK